MIELSVFLESFPLREVFTISRGSRTEAKVVRVVLCDTETGTVGQGECVPYARYGETPDGVVDTICGLKEEIAGGLDRIALQDRLPAGAARNGLDCAFWDLEAKQTGVPVHERAGLPAPQPLLTAFTLSVGETDAVLAQAKANADKPLLKIKLAGDGKDADRLEAIRRGAPESRLIVDANEALTLESLTDLKPALRETGVEMMEQPLAAASDGGLTTTSAGIPLCADESCHDRRSLLALSGKYDIINIKLDKTGGLTEAIALRAAAQAAGFRIMVGCMVSTSLSIAPAMLIAQGADYVDLDGPWLLARDRDGGVSFDGPRIGPALRTLWG